MLTPKTPAVSGSQQQGRDKSESAAAAGGHRKKERSASHQVIAGILRDKIIDDKRI